ncbi:MAG TPA: alpha/beta hydrolase fold domain-containing protein [Cyclobacteriaceae bacterium]|nr:alpha/beta hydrolase fold domain-containing protein [Cyclobacteriaceae bacterium]
MKSSRKIPTTILLIFAINFSHAQQIPFVKYLWENGAPGFEQLKDEPEQAKDYWVKHINNPSITVFLPEPDKAVGTAVLIFPGGGHRELVFDAEGRDAALFFNKIGVAAMVLKYRLAREQGSPYNLDHPKQDAYRAMRLIRENATQWGVNPEKVGVMGFSAGGEVAAMIAYENGNGDPDAKDVTDRINGKPDFQILVYPGPNGIPEKLPNDAPPAFMIAAIADPCCSAPIIKLLQKYHEAKIPAEVHIYAQGAHAFNMGQRATLKTLKTWPDRLADWMLDNHLLEK